MAPAIRFVLEERHRVMGELLCAVCDLAPTSRSVSLANVTAPAMYIARYAPALGCGVTSVSSNKSLPRLQPYA